MSRRGAEGALFVGRLSKSTRTRDLEEIFESYGRLLRCEIKYGVEMGYAFVDFEDRRDAEDAIRYENGRDVCGSSIIVEWAKGNPRRPMDGDHIPRGQMQRLGYDECYKCHKVGHWARDCPEDRDRYYGYRRPRARSHSRSRSRSRSRDGRRHSKSGYRRRSSRSRDRRRKSTSRSRSRSRTPDRKRRSSRSRSLEHKSRSRSRSRDGSPARSRSPTPADDKNGEAGSRSRSHSPARSRSRSRSP